MKKLFYTLSFGLLLWSCSEPDNDIISGPSTGLSSYTPIVMQRESFEKSISFQQAHSLQNIAKMYTSGNVIFISERYKGVHIIDNSDPSNPQNKGFIQVPGCIDVAYKSNVLYVSGGRDLIALDISDYQNPTELSRQTNIFPQLKDPQGLEANLQYPENAVVIDWVKN